MNAIEPELADRLSVLSRQGWSLVTRYELRGRGGHRLFGDRLEEIVLRAEHIAYQDEDQEAK